VSRPRVKICGITRLEDAERAVALGADAIGVVLWERSPRAVTAVQARAILRALPPFVTRVGVFVDATPATIRAIVDEVGLDAVQLHGDEPVEGYVDLRIRLIKAVTLTDDGAVQACTRLPAGVTPLVDAADRERRGGTGQLANWARAAALAGVRPAILAGGLTPANVEQAMCEVRPWALDVSSGVEDAPGVKNHDRLRALFDAVRRGEDR
jgi:phosphoribosylanthranilate isomerase